MIYLFIIFSRCLFCVFLLAAQWCFMWDSPPSHTTSNRDSRCLCQKRWQKKARKKHKEQCQSGIQSWVLSDFVFWIDKFQNDTINRWNNSNNVLLCILWLYFLTSISPLLSAEASFVSFFFHFDAWINEEISNKLDFAFVRFTVALINCFLTEICCTSVYLTEATGKKVLKHNTFWLRLITARMLISSKAMIN